MLDLDPVSTLPLHKASAGLGHRKGCRRILSAEAASKFKMPLGDLATGL